MLTDTQCGRAVPTFGFRFGFVPIGGIPPLRREAELTTKSLISVVDDDEGCREAVASLVKSMGFAVETYRSAADFLASPSLPHTSCLIADVHMDGMSGVELHNHLMESGHEIPTILITAFPDDRIRARALASGVVCYLSKTQDDDVLVGCIRSALEQPQS